MKNATKILRAYAARIDNSSLNDSPVCPREDAAVRLVKALDLGIDQIEGKTFGQIICLGMLAVHARAKQLGLVSSPVRVEECGPEVAPSREQLRTLFDQFATLNAQVWPAEEVFSPESENNRPYRKLGEAMHALYHLLKYQNMFAGGARFCDPTFDPIFQEGWQRASAGEAIAQRYLLEHWGISIPVQ